MFPKKICVEKGSAFLIFPHVIQWHFTRCFLSAPCTLWEAGGLEHRCGLAIGGLAVPSDSHSALLQLKLSQEVRVGGLGTEHEKHMHVSHCFTLAC